MAIAGSRPRLSDRSARRSRSWWRKPSPPREEARPCFVSRREFETDVGDSRGGVPECFQAVLL